MLVFHHNDADGRCAAAIVKRWFEFEKQRRSVIAINEPAIRFIEMDYNKTLPLGEILSQETVVIVDFSFKPEDMAAIQGRTESVIWCDHHKTAELYGYNVHGIRDFANKGRSGCECTWDFFFPHDKMPFAVSLVGDYDAWRLNYKDCFAFQEGLKMVDQSPTSQVWYSLLQNRDGGIVMDDIIAKGKVAIQYRDNYCAEVRKSFGYETMFEGHYAYALNTCRFGSMAFGELFKQYPVCIMYVHNGEQFTVSLYSETVDVSEIAKRYGGGGHKGASGFICETLPWRL